MCDTASSCPAEGICVETVTAPSNVAIRVRNVKLLSSVCCLMRKGSKSFTKVAWFQDSLNMPISTSVKTWNSKLFSCCMKLQWLTLQTQFRDVICDLCFREAVTLHAEAGKTTLLTRWNASHMAILGSKRGHAWSSRPTRLWWATKFQVEWWRLASTERTWDCGLTAAGHISGVAVSIFQFPMISSEIRSKGHKYLGSRVV